jgi:transposase-like protein
VFATLWRLPAKEEASVIQIHALLDDDKCFKAVRELRWPSGVRCPHCNTSKIVKRGFHDTQKARQRYECVGCRKQFDDLTDTIFEGHHQPLQAWIVCLYMMGLNLSNQQIADELDLNKDDVQAMTTCLREGIVAKKSPSL